MNISVPLDRMTPAEKLELIEIVWADLCRDDVRFDSPTWHEGVLRNRDEAVRTGRETPIDWETAKAKLRSLRR